MNARWLDWLVGAGLLLAGFAGGMVLSGYARAGGDGSSAADWVSAGANLLMALAAIGGIFAAVRGLKSWRQETLGKGEIDFLKALYLCVDRCLSHAETSRSSTIPKGKLSSKDLRAELLYLLPYLDGDIEELGKNLLDIKSKVEGAGLYISVESFERISVFRKLLFNLRMHKSFLAYVLRNEIKNPDPDLIENILKICTSQHDPEDRWGAEFSRCAVEILNDLKARIKP